MEFKDKNINLLEESIGYSFQDKRLLSQSLVHKSYGNENREYKFSNNERLELLGDSVLGLIVTKKLYNFFPQLKEGDLVRIRSKIVNEATVSSFADEISLGDFLMMGRGEEQRGGRSRRSILCDSFEALIGAIYIDGGLDKVEEKLAHFLNPILEKVEPQNIQDDFKTQLQQHFQSRHKELPQYIFADGEEKSQKFVVHVEFRGEKLGKGEGSSKQEATKKAAQEALKYLQKEGM